MPYVITNLTLVSIAFYLREPWVLLIALGAALVGVSLKANHPVSKAVLAAAIIFTSYGVVTDTCGSVGYRQCADK